MLARLELTRRLVDELDGDMALETAMADWWYSKRETGGFRLTDKGAQALAVDLGLKFYEFVIKPQDLDSKTLLALDRHLAMPYYIVYTGRQRQPSKVVFFGGRDATLAMLYDDIQVFARSAPGRP